jgi:hypothetical protein
VLHIDPQDQSDRARKAFDSHLSRAKWMTEHGVPAPATWWRVGVMPNRAALRGRLFCRIF